MIYVSLAVLAVGSALAVLCATLERRGYRSGSKIFPRLGYVAVGVAWVCQGLALAVEAVAGLSWPSWATVDGWEYGILAGVGLFLFWQWRRAPRRSGPVGLGTRRMRYAHRVRRIA